MEEDFETKLRVRRAYADSLRWTTFASITIRLFCQSKF